MFVSSYPLATLQDMVAMKVAMKAKKATEEATAKPATKGALVAMKVKKTMKAGGKGANPLVAFDDLTKELEAAEARTIDNHVVTTCIYIYIYIYIYFVSTV